MRRGRSACSRGSRNQFFPRSRQRNVIVAVREKARVPLRPACDVGTPLRHLPNCRYSSECSAQCQILSPMIWSVSTLPLNGLAFDLVFPFTAPQSAGQVGPFQLTHCSQKLAAQDREFLSRHASRSTHHELQAVLSVITRQCTRGDGQWMAGKHSLFVSAVGNCDWSCSAAYRRVQSPKRVAQTQACCTVRRSRRRQEYFEEWPFKRSLLSPAMISLVAHHKVSILTVLP